MAAQSGVLFFDGRPADDEVETLAASLEPFALDGVSTVVRAGIAMAFGACHVWTGEESCTQPLQTPVGVLMTWDGRLDNRDDLLLRLSGRLDEGASDAATALEVFDRWGVDGLRSLIGDWSLVIWNSRARTLHLARDYMGVRPLYYCADETRVMWSTSLGELALRFGRVDDLDEAFVARFMTVQFSTEVTPYVGIRGVPTSTCVSFSSGGDERRQRFWQLDPGVIRYRDRGQYEEQLRALWSDAVGCRLRTVAPVFAELSGGLDSSSIVCMADALLRAGRVPAKHLQPVSHVTFDSPEGDERRFISEVEAKIGVHSALFGLEAHESDRDEWDWVTPVASRGVDVAIMEHLRERGGRLLLTGRAGDIVMGCVPDHSVAVLDDVAGGHLFAAAKNIRRWSRATQKPFAQVAANVGREAIRGLLTRCVAPTLTAHQLRGMNLLAPHLRRLAADGARAIDLSGVRPSARPTATQLLRYASSAVSTVPTCPPDIFQAHPFLHRPLVDFMFAIPATELSAPGETRALMRRAFAGLVPARILARTSKGYYPPSVMRTTRDLTTSMATTESLQVVRRGWLAAEPLAAAIRALRHGTTQDRSEVRLALLLEQWLSARDRRGPAVMPTRKEVTTNAVLNA